jgi:hypothetical protein
MADWTLTKEQASKIVDYVLQVVEYGFKEGSCLASIPSVDAEIEKNLRALGCPYDLIATWRKRVREWRYEDFVVPLSEEEQAKLAKWREENDFVPF